jgi:hypothetical protein
MIRILRGIDDTQVSSTHGIKRLVNATAMSSPHSCVSAILFRCNKYRSKLLCTVVNKCFVENLQCTRKLHINFSNFF